MTDEQQTQDNGDKTSTTNEAMIPYARFKSALERQADFAEKLTNAEKEIEARDKRIAELSNDENLKALRAENERLKAVQTKVYNEKKTNLAQTLSDLSTHGDFEKFSKNVTLPEMNEGKIDPSKMTDEQADIIASKLMEYKSIGLFSTDAKKTAGNGQTFKSGDGPENFYGYASPTELLQKAPEKYKEYRRARGLA